MRSQSSGGAVVSPTGAPASTAAVSRSSSTSARARGLAVEVLLDLGALVGLERVEHVRAEQRVQLGRGSMGVVTGVLPRR